MSLDYQNLCFKILFEYYGEVVAKVGEILLKNDFATLSYLCSQSKLPRNKVQGSLCVLIKHNLVDWKEVVKGIPSYFFFSDRIVLMLRFPRYILWIREQFGEEAELIVDIIIREGQITASQIIISSCIKLLDAAELSGSGTEDRHIAIRNALSLLIEKHYVQLCPSPESNKNTTVPNLILQKDNLFRFQHESIDLRSIQQEIQRSRANPDQCGHLQDTNSLDRPDANIFWRLNYDQFHLEFRDVEICDSLSRRIDPLAGACLGAILKVSYRKSDPWHEILNTVTMSEIRDQQKDLSHLEQYLKILVECGGGCLRKVGDAGGGEYVVNIGAIIKSIVFSNIENIIQERYGSKAARIFRLVKENGMMEQDPIIKLSMISNKEACLLMSQLLEDGFFQLHDLRKSLAISPANKSIFMYYVDPNSIVLSLLEWCYKALFNLVVQREIRQIQHKRLLDKKSRMESIVDNLKQSNASEDQIREVEESFTPSETELVKKVLDVHDKLLARESALDELIFIFQMYHYYHIAKQ